jgi:hypothetical protein
MKVRIYACPQSDSSLRIRSPCCQNSYELYSVLPLWYIQSLTIYFTACLTTTERKYVTAIGTTKNEKIEIFYTQRKNNFHGGAVPKVEG